jgi:UDP-N-acetylglucosamine 4-epimerase
MSAYKQLQNRLAVEPSSWLVTGVAGFIGSHLLERLLKLGQHVVGLDNMSMGQQRHLEEVRSQVSYAQWRNFEFIRGDVTVIKDCDKACKNVDYVLHQATIPDHASPNEFLTLFVSARDAKVKHFVYAVNPIHSHHAGLALDNSVYAISFGQAYGLLCTGLNYANIFGPRQSHSTTTALIPTWAQSLLSGLPVHINGDGESSADFCFIDNAVQANLLAVMAPPFPAHQVYNVASGVRTTLNAVYDLLQVQRPTSANRLAEPPVYGDLCDGDLIEAALDISQTELHLGYVPTHQIAQGLTLTTPWYSSHQ